MVEALDRMWPLLSPEELLHDLFGALPLIALAGGGILTPAEQELLRRDRGDPTGPVTWTEADIPLLDEALSLLGPRRRPSPEHPDPIRTYGHVVVDEAQDLSPMQLRMVARRSLSGSMTVVGDVAQATGPWAPTSWSQVVEHLPSRRGWDLVELTVNYRTPSEIMDLAARVLDAVAPGMRAPESVRAAGRRPRVVPSGRDAFGGDAQLVAAVVGAVRDELELVGDGTLAVIVPPSAMDAIGSGLEAAGLDFGTAGREALDRQVSLLGVDDAKGLEFDSVTVVEPARIATESAQGLRSLYVAFTRATQRLTIVHSEPLPTALSGAVQHTA
jgi:DNA helicase IV